MRKHFTCFIFISFLYICAYSQVTPFIPKPTGTYFVGTKKLFFTDNSRNEKLTSKWGDKRQVQVKIWYPADVKGQTENLYLEDYSSEILWKSYNMFKVNISFFDSLKNYKTYSYKNIPVSKKQANFPLIIFSQGFYFGLDDFYTNIMENLASHGYIVASITHPYDQVITNTPEGNYLTLNKLRMFKAYTEWKQVEFMHAKTPDPTNTRKTNRILKAYLNGMKVFNQSLDIWTKDVQFVMDTLKSTSNNAVNDLFYQKIDFSKVGSLGQSFGGAVSGQLCFANSEIKAGINLDCFQFGDLYKHEMNKPFMLLQSDSYPLWELGNQMIYTKTNPFYSIKIKDARHFIFSDCCLFPVAESNTKMGELVGPPNNILENVNMINTLIIDFYNHYLNNIPLKSVLK